MNGEHLEPDSIHDPLSYFDQANELVAIKDGDSLLPIPYASTYKPTYQHASQS